MWRRRISNSIDIEKDFTNDLRPKFSKKKSPSLKKVLPLHGVQFAQLSSLIYDASFELGNLQENKQPRSRISKDIYLL